MKYRAILLWLLHLFLLLLLSFWSFWRWLYLIWMDWHISNTSLIVAIGTAFSLKITPPRRFQILFIHAAPENKQKHTSPTCPNVFSWGTSEETRFYSLQKPKQIWWETKAISPFATMWYISVFCKTMRDLCICAI